LKALDVESSKVIDLETFVPRGDLDPVYFDSSYYLYPDGPIAVETLRVIAASRRRKGILARDRFAPDSPLEGDGFELPVPRE
jgi:DNA end-binding protein Ku